MYGGPIGTHQRSFRWSHPRRPPLVWAQPGTAPIFGYPLLTQEQVKLWTSNLAGTFTGCIRTKSH